MSDSRLGPARAENAAPGPGSENPKPPANQAVLGPFTVRDLAVFAGVLVTFLGSLLPMMILQTPYGYPNLWNAAGLYYLGIGILVPLALAGLFVWRRVAADASIRIGSLSLDQFASVVAVLSASFFFLLAVTTASLGGIVGFLGGAILVAATVFARMIPPFAGDFEGRAEVPAHVVARDAVAPLPKPAPLTKPAAQPAQSQPAPSQGSAIGAPWAGSYAHDDEARQGGEGTLGAGVSSAGAAAAAAGFAGATAAGAGVAAIAAGAMAAGEGASHAEGAESPSEYVEAAGAAGPPPAAAVPGWEDAERFGEPEAVVPGFEPEAAPSAVGQAAEPATAALAAAAAGGPEGAFIAGDADGEVYGAPSPESPAEVDFGHTRLMPAASADEGREPEATPAVDRAAGIEATQHEEPEPAYDAFWFAVSESRTAVDPQSGLPVFTLEPGQWILALQDRGHEFLVQSQDGRIGVLRDLSGIERG
ncbi:hypothetical protein [Sinomonas sp. ASV322]|uniref:hypothetical protein n=1 Tax=Sinomonas sp. ASV322 TaxID=3041920 RepID=UPI0027DDD5CC|nr:hypothetical protein [Sinomonas sp. ASV322]MDQ4503797.1 hypothetical protein [Sinomonas sp. ASV322]